MGSRYAYFSGVEGGNFAIIGEYELLDLPEEAYMIGVFMEGNPGIYDVSWTIDTGIRNEAGLIKRQNRILKRIQADGTVTGAK